MCLSVTPTNLYISTNSLTCGKSFFSQIENRISSCISEFIIMLLRYNIRGID